MFLNKYFNDNILDNEDFYNELNEIDVEKVKPVLYNEIEEKFMWNFFAEGYITDYGLQPLQKLLIQLANENNSEKKLIVIDKILNVVHQTTDLAAWFIEGGSRSLSLISGYDDEEGDSKISGKYRMSDYYGR
jgi:hypothetical protein